VGLGTYCAMVGAFSWRFVVGYCQKRSKVSWGWIAWVVRGVRVLSKSQQVLRFAQVDTSCGSIFDRLVGGFM